MTKGPLPDHELRWARAVNRDRENNSHLNEIASDFRKEFYPTSPLHQIFMGGTDEGIGATIFFNTDADIAQCDANGISQAMRDFVYEKLEEYGRGKRDELDVQFEFDSFENVQKNYDGNYVLRMG